MAEVDQAKADKAHEAASRRGTQSSPEKTPEEVRYSEQELREGAQGLLGVSPHAVAAALYGQTRKTHTLAEAERLVNVYLGRAEEGQNEEVGT